MCALLQPAAQEDHSTCHSEMQPAAHGDLSTRNSMMQPVAHADHSTRDSEMQAAPRLGKAACSTLGCALELTAELSLAQVQAALRTCSR